jgi:uncharacterized protein (TIGR02147 family)
MNKVKSIYEYTSYRDFLKDSYARNKAQNPKFSFRYFARIAGFKACNVLKLVMDGKRNLALESISKFAKALKLNREESEFFTNLVLHNQAGNSVDRQHYAELLVLSRGYKRVHPLKDEQYHFLGNWYYPVIWELVSLPTFREDYEWISKNTRPSITPFEARRTIEALVKMGLLKRDAKGRLSKSEAGVVTPDEVTASSVAGFHREMMKRASESIDAFPRDKRDISGFTFALSEGTAGRVKEMVQKFRKDILDMVLQDQQPDGVYQLNFQFFPHILLPREKEEEK